MTIFTYKLDDNSTVEIQANNKLQAGIKFELLTGLSSRGRLLEGES